jgi:hypothetical protein
MTDYEEFERTIKNMQPRQKAFEIVKKEMKARGHWKNKPRGKPDAKYFKK